MQLELGNGSYDSPEAFFKQLHLVFLNAKRCEPDTTLCETHLTCQ